MTIEEELVYLREEHTVLRDQLAQRDELIQQHGEQMSHLSEQLKGVQERLAKDSHNSHLPPFADRFVRQAKSLRKKSEKKEGGQPGHPGSSLSCSLTPDEVIEQHVERCEACQHDLHAVAACGRERRQAGGCAVAASGGAGISSRAETVSRLPAHHQGRPFPPEYRPPCTMEPTWERWPCTWSNSNCCRLPRACEVLSDLLEVAEWQARFLELLEEGDRLHPPALAPPGTRGRCKQSPARHLLDRLRKHQQAVLLFLKDLRVDFDNNLAERDLRMVKVQQKVSGCFRSAAGSQAFARIRGYVPTLRKQCVPLLSALQATLAGHPVLPSL